MTTTINASPTNGIVQTADGSGVMKLQSNGVTTNALAWVNFTGSTAVIKSSYNVSSITRASTGIYQLNFTNSLADVNYAGVCSSSVAASSSSYQAFTTTGSSTTTYGVHTTTALGINVYSATAANFIDPESVQVAIFGN